MDIKIKSYVPGELDSWISLTADGVDYDVHYDHDKRSRTGILHDGLEEDHLTDEQREAIIARVELFFTFFDAEALKVAKDELAARAIAEMDQHLAQVAASNLRLHHAVKIIGQGWHGENGIITSTLASASTGIYEVTYWVGSTPTVHEFHYRDLAAL
jgi:hypothetical protein